jgi:glucan phosphorylase
LRDTNAFLWLQSNVPQLTDKTLLTLSMEGNIPEFAQYPDAQNANTRGGLGAYFGDKLEGLFAIGMKSWGAQPMYSRIIKDGQAAEVDYEQLIKEGVIKRVLGKDGELLVLQVYAWDDIEPDNSSKNNLIKVEVWLVNRGGTPLFLLRSPEVFDFLYTDYRVHRFTQEVVFGKAVYQLMKTLDIIPDILHLN